MKNHAIIPIFIPHEGCENDCVFCNQKIITAKTHPITPDGIVSIIEKHLSTLNNTQVTTVEVAFFGGSFTGLSIEDQNRYLSVAKAYKDNGNIDKIHLSTRPDYIDEEILSNLKAFGVDIIELGVQSFNQKVLDASKRGHTVEDIYNACSLIKEYGFALGIQLMIGLPGDTPSSAIKSAQLAAEIKPQLARLYPTVVLDDTELLSMYKAGLYSPLSEKEAIDICKTMYQILFNAGVTIMRVGLKSTDLITNDSDRGGSYHPAFRQLVEGAIAKEFITDEISKCDEKELSFISHPKSFSNMIGHKGINKKFFIKHYPSHKIIFFSDESIPVGKYLKK